MRALLIVIVRDFLSGLPSGRHCTPSCLLCPSIWRCFPYASSPVPLHGRTAPRPEPQHRNGLCSKRFLRRRSLGYLFWTDFSAATAWTILRAPAARRSAAASPRSAAGSGLPPPVKVSGSGHASPAVFPSSPAEQVDSKCPLYALRSC
jgi:hypothetical protein